MTTAIVITIIGAVVTLAAAIADRIAAGRDLADPLTGHYATVLAMIADEEVAR